MEEKKELQHMFLKVPHHGRYNDQLENFLSVVNPSYAVITCSTKNPPDDEALSSLSKNKVETYLTLKFLLMKQFTACILQKNFEYSVYSLL